MANAKHSGPVDIGLTCGYSLLDPISHSSSLAHSLAITGNQTGQYGLVFTYPDEPSIDALRSFHSPYLLPVNPFVITI